MPLNDWDEKALEELAAQVWGAVEYQGSKAGARTLRSVIEEVNR